MQLTKALVLPLFDLDNMHQNKLPKLKSILDNLDKTNTKEIVLFNNLNKEYTDILTYLPIIPNLQPYNITIITKGELPLYLSTLNATIIDLEKEYEMYRNTIVEHKSYSMLDTNLPKMIVKKEDLVEDEAIQIGFLGNINENTLRIKEEQPTYTVSSIEDSSEGLLDNLLESDSLDGGLLDSISLDNVMLEDNSLDGGLLDNLTLEPAIPQQEQIETPPDQTQILLALALKSKQTKKEPAKKEQQQTDNQYVNTLMALVNHTNSKNKKQSSKSQKKSKTKSTSISKTLTYDEYISIKTKEILQDLKLVVDINKQSPILTELKKLLPKQVIKIQIEAQECKVTLAGNKIKANYINMEGVI